MVIQNTDSTKILDTYVHQSGVVLLVRNYHMTTDSFWVAQTLPGKVSYKVKVSSEGMPLLAEYLNEETARAAFDLVKERFGFFENVPAPSTVEASTWVW